MQKMSARKTKNQGGMVLVWVTLALVMLLSIAAYAIDVSYMYQMRANAQRCADMAALAGAYALEQGQTKSAADTAAYTSLSGDASNFTLRDSGGNVNVGTNPYLGNGNWYHVRVIKTVPMFFAQIFGKKSTLIAAEATSYYNIAALIGGDPNFNGISDGPINLSDFGPYGKYGNGDAYSTILDDGGNNNSLYNNDYSTGTPRVGGYNYKITIPANHVLRDYTNTLGSVGTANGSSSIMNVQIFDPDCYNYGSRTDTSPAVPANNDPGTYDEYRKTFANGGSTGSSADATTTGYTLYWDNDTPYNMNDDVLVASASYGLDANTDMKWVTPNGFSVNLNDSRWSTGNFRLNVQATAGSSENGYNIRISSGNEDVYTPMLNTADNNGDKYSPQVDTSGIYSGKIDNAAWEEKWHERFTQLDGTKKQDNTSNPATLAQAKGLQATGLQQSVGHLPLNFNANGNGVIELGYVPAAPAGSQQVVTITKFDTDVGAISVTYKARDSGGNVLYTYTGVISTAPGAFSTDVYTLPTNYPGANWEAIYTASSSDTSSWTVSYKSGQGIPGGIKLIGSTASTPY